MNYWWPNIQSLEDVKAASKNGAIAASVFAGMMALGFIATYLGYNDLIANQQIPADEINSTLVSIGISIVIILFAAWRINSGKGYISAIFVFLLFLFEIGLKIFSGTTNLFWLFAYASIAAGMFGAIRATLSYKEYAAQDDLESVF